MDIENTVINFISGSEKQKLWATALRGKYVDELLDQYSPQEVKAFITARPTAKWWIDNRAKLTMENSTSLLRAAFKALEKAGTVEQYLDKLILAAAEKAKKLEDYQQEQLKREALWEEEEYLEEVFEDRERPW